MTEERIRKECRAQYDEGLGYMSPYATGTLERRLWDSEVNKILNEIYNERRGLSNE